MVSYRVDTVQGVKFADYFSPEFFLREGAKRWAAYIEADVTPPISEIVVPPFNPNFAQQKELKGIAEKIRKVFAAPVRELATEQEIRDFVERISALPYKPGFAGLYAIAKYEEEKRKLREHFGSGIPESDHSVFFAYFGNPYIITEDCGRVLRDVAKTLSPDGEGHPNPEMIKAFYLLSWNAGKTLARMHNLGWAEDDSHTMNYVSDGEYNVRRIDLRLPSWPERTIREARMNELFELLDDLDLALCVEGYEATLNPEIKRQFWLDHFRKRFIILNARRDACDYITPQDREFLEVCQEADIVKGDIDAIPCRDLETLQIIQSLL